MNLINKSVGESILPNIRRYSFYINTILDHHIAKGILYEKFREQHLAVLQARIKERVAGEQASCTKLQVPFSLKEMIKCICMEMGDEEDRRLLKEQPSLLLLKYQILIHQMVQGYQQSGTLKMYDVQEIVHEMNVVLLHRIWHKLSQFEGRSTFRTFMSRVLRNLLHETYHRLLRDQHYHGRHYSLEELLEIQPGLNGSEAHPLLEPSFSKPTLWRDYNSLFDWALCERSTQHRFSERLFCLKIHHRVLLSETDIRIYQPNIAQVNVQRFLDAFGETTRLENLQYRKMSKGLLFDKLAAIISVFRRKKVSGATLQRTQCNWEKSLLEELLSQMNVKEAQEFDWEHFIHWKYG